MQLIDWPEQPVSGWISCKDRGECNYLGLRGREIVYTDEDFVVVLLGDSETQAFNYFFHQMPERILEDYLRRYHEHIKVFTVGGNGYGQDQQLLVLKEYLKKHRADLVLLMFTAYNDIVNNTFPTEGANDNYKPTFWIEDGELQGPTEGWLELAGPWFKPAILWERFWGKSRKEQWEAILPTPYQPLSEYNGEIDYSWQPAWDDGNWGRVHDIKTEKLDKSLRLTPRSERLKYSIDLTRLLFSEIQIITEAQNGHFIIFKDERPWEVEGINIEKAYFLNNKYFKSSTKQYRDNLIELFRGFEQYRIPLNMSNPSVSKNNSHLNQRALHILMEELALIISKKEYCCIP